jgi:hypothetical protein
MDFKRSGFEWSPSKTNLNSSALYKIFFQNSEFLEKKIENHEICASRCEFKNSSLE